MTDKPDTIPPLPIAVAAAIAGVDRRRFNEAVADGSYKCAPDTKARQRRFFSEADVLGMCVFERLFNSGMHKADAGRMACDVLEHYQDAERDGRNLVAVTFPSGITHYHGIPSLTDARGEMIPSQEEAEFVAIVVRVSVLIEAIRTRYRDFHPNVFGDLDGGYDA